MNHAPRGVPDRSGTTWRSSTHSGGNNECVEVSDAPGAGVPVRDGKRPHGPVITFTPHAWRAFVSGLG